MTDECGATADVDREEEKWKQGATTTSDISVLLIGCPGSGKSTLGNILSASPPFPNENFPSSAETNSCTVSIRSVVHNFEGSNITWIDTPGFPDTEPDKVCYCYLLCLILYVSFRSVTTMMPCRLDNIST